MADDLTGWRRLACAVLLQAWRDAHNSNGAKVAREAGIPDAIGLAGDARYFLDGDGAAWLVLALGFDGSGLERVRAELPRPPCEQLTLFEVA